MPVTQVDIAIKCPDPLRAPLTEGVWLARLAEQLQLMLDGTAPAPVEKRKSYTREEKLKVVKFYFDKGNNWRAERAPHLSYSGEKSSSYNYIYVTVLAETNLKEQFVIIHYGRFYR